MTPDQIERIRPRLVEFTAGMLDVLARSDQRAKGELYVRGLLTDGRRKSMQPMAQRLGVDHQKLQQFVTSSTWDHTLVRRNVARWAADTISPQAYVVDDTGFAKDGTASPCVARQYSGTLGKIGNCQVAVSMQLVTDHASPAANWRLFCPSSWDDTLAQGPAAAEESRVLACWPNTPAKRLQSYNFQDRYVRHTSMDVRIDANVSPVDGSQFRLRKGLAGSGTVSFESADYPGYFLRHFGFDFQLVYNDGTAQFAADATFRQVAGLTDATWSSFQSYNHPDRYLRHYAYQLRLDPITTATSRSDATFRVTS